MSLTNELAALNRVAMSKHGVNARIWSYNVNRMTSRDEWYQSFKMWRGMRQYTKAPRGVDKKSTEQWLCTISAMFKYCPAFLTDMFNEKTICEMTALNEQLKKLP